MAALPPTTCLEKTKYERFFFCKHPLTMYIKKIHKVPHLKKENHKNCLLLQIVQILAVLRVISTVFKVKKGVFCSFSKSFYSCLGVGKALFLPLKYQLLIVFSAQNFTPLTSPLRSCESLTKTHRISILRFMNSIRFQDVLQ